MTRPAVSARGVEKRFGHTAAIAGLDLEIAPGSSVAVLGPNGAGKSTLLRMLAGLARPTAGTLEVGGVRADRPAARARVGLIGHATFLYPALTARENLTFAGRLHRVPDPPARADALLAELGLDAVAQRPAGTFSRGMAQRLAIGRALVHEPDVVLLDEPFTGLDRGAADRLAARLAILREQGRTLFLVTHDAARAAELADAALLLVDGRVAHATHAPVVDDLERAYAAATGAAG